MASPNDPSPSKYVSKLKLRALNAEQQEEAGPSTVYLISDLKDKHSDKKWEIKGVLVWRSHVGSASATNSDVLSTIFTDGSGFIQVAFWNREARTYDELLVVGHTYKIIRGRVVESKYKYTWVRNPFRITITSRSSVEKTDDPWVRFPFQFSSFNQNLVAGKDIDLIGIIFDISAQPESSAGKWNMTLKDEEGRVAIIQMWAEMATEISKQSDKLNRETTQDVVIAMSGMRVSTFAVQGRAYVESFKDSIVEFNPDLPRANELHAYLLASEATTEDLTDPEDAAGNETGATSEKKDTPEKMDTVEEKSANN